VNVTHCLPPSRRPERRPTRARAASRISPATDIREPPPAAPAVPAVRRASGRAEDMCQCAPSPGTFRTTRGYRLGTALHRLGHQVGRCDTDRAPRASNPSRRSSVGIEFDENLDTVPHIGLSPLAVTSYAASRWPCLGRRRDPVSLPDIIADVVVETHLKNSRTGSAPRQRVNLVMRCVDAETGARRAVEAETMHQRLRAMMAGADGDPLTIEQGRDVMGVCLSSAKATTPPRSCA